MPISQKINEAGWFYHAPAKKHVGAERTEGPAPSQIPGIGYDDPTIYEKEEVRPVVFKDTDSKYIQMAKMGGRKDLLSFNPELYKKKGDEAHGYPRNEWFYLEDNRMEDEQKKQEESWDFLLPEYMVHKGYQPSFDNPSTPPVRSGAPYHTEKQSVMSEGKSATDKTVKIPEVRRPGFGVRNEKPPPTMKNLPKENPARQPKKNNSFNMPTETDDPTNMSKLLAGGYERDWYDKRGVYEAMKGGDAKCAKDGPAKKETRSQNNSAAHSYSQSKKQEEEKDLFKMTKFKNVLSKVDSHQRPEIIPVHHK